MSEAHDATLAHHFETHEQQNHAAAIGMWAFLVQEVMFFGGLFAAYLVYRSRYPEVFLYGSHELPVLWGTANTAVLIGSSLTMALAVRCAQLGQARKTAFYIVATIGLALVFLGVKSFEYAEKYHHGLIPGVHWDPPADAPAHLNVFFALYFIMTGAHAVHMLIGLVIMLFVIARALRGRYSAKNYIGVEVLGLYWHFVDLVWIFLFPLLYLLSRNVPGLGGH